MNAIIIPNQAAIAKWKSLAITIVSPASEAAARAHLTNVRLAAKQLALDIKLLKEPHQAAIKAVDDASKPWRDILAERDQSLEQAILVYRRAVAKAAEDANRKALEKYEKKVERVEAQAVERGQPMPMVLPPSMITTAPKSVLTDGATQTVVTRKTWRIPGVTHPEQLSRGSTLAKAVPDEYFLLDAARIGKVIRAGGSIPGIEMITEESLTIRSN